MTLTSDVGFAYAAQMKAVLVREGVPPGHIVDLAHDLPTHGVREGAFLLREMAKGFPPFVVHLAVVDPGVGGGRRPIAIETRSGAMLVGPDNGLLMPLAETLGMVSVHQIEPAKLAPRPRVGTTFDGRDLFAPAAARLALGAPPSSLGRLTTPRSFSLPRPVLAGRGAQGEVLHVDRFGNLISNFPTAWVEPATKRLTLAVAQGRPRRIPWATSYESLGRGVLGALGSSFGLVEIAVGEGRASDRLRANVGTGISLRWSRRSAVPGETVNSARPRKRP